MRKSHSIAALCGDGLRPELRELFNRLAVDPNSELFVRHGSMLQAGPDPKSEAAPVERALPQRVAKKLAAAPNEPRSVRRAR
jgi:hypothetical protein